MKFGLGMDLSDISVEKLWVTYKKTRANCRHLAVGLSRSEVQLKVRRPSCTQNGEIQNIEINQEENIRLQI